MRFPVGDPRAQEQGWNVGVLRVGGAMGRSGSAVVDPSRLGDEEHVA